MSIRLAPSLGIGPYVEGPEPCARADGLVGVPEVLRSEVDAAGQ